MSSSVIESLGSLRAGDLGRNSARVGEENFRVRSCLMGKYSPRPNLMCVNNRVIVCMGIGVLLSKAVVENGGTGV